MYSDIMLWLIAMTSAKPCKIATRLWHYFAVVMVKNAIWPLCLYIPLSRTVSKYQNEGLEYRWQTVSNTNYYIFWINIEKLTVNTYLMQTEKKYCSCCYHDDIYLSALEMYFISFALKELTEIRKRDCFSPQEKATYFSISCV